VHLSKIDMPELKPRVNSQPQDKHILKEWEKKGKGKEKEKDKDTSKEKPAKKDKRKENDKKQKERPSPPPPGKIAKPSTPSSRPPPSSSYPIPPPVPHKNRPISSMWVQHPSQYNQPLYQQHPGALNTTPPPPPPPPPQLSAVVSNLMGRLDRFARR
jgi:hypothetical protein